MAPLWGLPPQSDQDCEGGGLTRYYFCVRRLNASVAVVYKTPDRSKDANRATLPMIVNAYETRSDSSVHPCYQCFHSISVKKQKRTLSEQY